MVAKMRDRLPRPLPKPRLDPRGIDDFEDLGYLSEEVGVGGPGSSNVERIRGEWMVHFAWGWLECA